MWRLAQAGVSSSAKGGTGCVTFRQSARGAKECSAGYEKGQRDFAKRQYQALTERQWFAPQSDDAAHLRLFDVRFARLFPEREQNGVILAPGTATLRIQE